MPSALHQAFQALTAYDPRFSLALYDGSFHQGFDHAETVQRITVPAVLIDANWSHEAGGTPWRTWTQTTARPAP